MQDTPGEDVGYYGGEEVGVSDYSNHGLEKEVEVVGVEGVNYVFGALWCLYER